MTLPSAHPPATPGPLGHYRPTALPRFFFGAAYYPEYWAEDQWDRHADLMAEAKVSLVRLAEFAWDRMEPTPGAFDLDWLERAVDGLAKRNIAVMLCTPTAAPPRWVTADRTMLRVDENDRPMLHGSRQHASHAHEGFRALGRRVTEAMAERFAKHDAVVGWQTDNEIHCHFSQDHCEAVQTAFRAWCEEKYGGDIAALNADWGLAFWSQTLTSFEQVDTPRPNRPTHVNPSHQLRYFQFLSDVAATFQAEQVAILRTANPAWWVTHNGTFHHIDYRGKFGQDLDFFSDDVYPMFAGAGEGDRAAWQAYRCDTVRAWTGNFFVPEHQNGSGSQEPYILDTPTPDEFRQMALRTVARGADGMLMFRWRSCPSGAELYWQGVLDHDGRPRSRYAAFKSLGHEFAAWGDEVLGTSVRVDVAIAGSDQTVTDGVAAYGMGLDKPRDLGGVVHRDLFESGYAVGVVHPSDDLSDVSLYVVPGWPLFDPAWVEPLTAWVRAGGVLVIGGTTATRHMNNQVTLDTAPGVLSELCGIRVAEFAKRGTVEDRPTLSMEGRTAPATAWFEGLERRADAEDDTEVLSRWEGGAWTGAGMPAVVVRRLGAGRVVYAGTPLDAAVWSALGPWCVSAAGLQPVLPGAPRGVEAVERYVRPAVMAELDAARSQGAERVDRRLLFVLNRNAEPAEVSLPAGTRRIDRDEHIDERFTLPPHGSAVFRCPSCR
ncbi:MAG: beta-galactosidase [Planctomycetota bacterium]